MILTHIHRGAPRVVFAFGAVDDAELWKGCSPHQQTLLWKAGLVLLCPNDADSFGVAKLIGYSCITAPGALEQWCVAKVAPPEAFAGQYPCWGQGGIRFATDVTNHLRSLAV